MLCSLPFWYLITRLRKEVPLGKGNHLVLLVHGYINAGFVWDLHKKWLVEEGCGPIYTIDLGNPFDSIHTFADRLKHKVEAILRETKHKELTLVGHSMGGLVSAYYALRLAPQGTICSVITLGAPLYGTKTAFLGFGRCAQEMRVGSKFLKELHLLYSIKRDVKFYHVVTTVDEIVIPYASGIFINNNHNALIVNDLSHASLLMSQRVAHYVANLIARK